MSKAKILAFGASLLSKGKKAAPTIMIAVGVAASIAATVEAVKSTLKAEEYILDPAKEEFDTIKQAEENPAYTEEAKKIDKRAVYIRSIGRALKLYGKPLALWTLSMVMIIGAHKIQCDRLTRALNYGALATTALTNMHENTKQTFGEDVAMAMRTGEGIPEAVEKCDFDQVKDNVKKKIQYKSDSLRDYPDKEVSYRTSEDTIAIVKFCQSTIKPNYWNDDPVERLKNLRAWENMYNELLVSREIDVVTGEQFCKAIGYIPEEPIFDIMGWWYDGSTVRPIDLGLGTLYAILDDPTLTSAEVRNKLIYTGRDDRGHGLKTPWDLVFNFTGDVFQHKFGIDVSGKVLDGYNKHNILRDPNPATL